MQLLTVCDPLFQYICRLRRSAAGRRAIDPLVIQTDIRTILKDAEAAASRDPQLKAQWEAVIKPLVFFVDYTITSSELPGSRQWEALAYKMFHELAGDEKFFALLEQELQDRTEQATERLAVCHTCLGLGFRGLHANNPDQIEKYMSQTSARVAPAARDRRGDYLCPQAYEHTDERNLVEPPNHKLVVIGLIFLIGLAVWFWASKAAFRSASREITNTVESIKAQK